MKAILSNYVRTNCRSVTRDVKSFLISGLFCATALLNNKLLNSENILMRIQYVLHLLLCLFVAKKFRNAKQFFNNNTHVLQL
jgi:hypothetical protein